MNIASSSTGVHPAIYKINQIVAISKATAGLIELLPGCTDDIFEISIDKAVHSFKSGNSASCAVFDGYNYARNMIKMANPPS